MDRWGGEAGRGRGRGPPGPGPAPSRWGPPGPDRHQHPDRWGGPVAAEAGRRDKWDKWTAAEGKLNHLTIQRISFQGVARLRALLLHNCCVLIHTQTTGLNAHL